MRLILTCEHAGNEIPEEYRHLFQEEEQLLNSHRGYDPGAFDLFDKLKEQAHSSHFQMKSRLLVEANRSLHHPQLFSEITRTLAADQKTKILEKYYAPYRKAVEKDIRSLTEAGEKVLHVSVHTFTPELNREVRNADAGFLYDSRRKEEKAFCAQWKDNINTADPKLKLRFNYPYLGKADGFTTYLRKQFKENYLGIELEVNQKFVRDGKMDPSLKNNIAAGLRMVTGGPETGNRN